MKWLTISLSIVTLTSASGCWRPYYGRNYAPPALAQPAIAPPTYAQPTYQQPVVQTQPVVQAQPYVQPQVIQASGVQCQPCQPNPCCVPCY